MKKVNLLLLLAVLLVSGCGSVEKLGNSFGSGLNKNSRDIARNVMSGVQDKLADSVFRRDLTRLLDSIIYQAGLSTGKSAISIRDSLLNEKWLVFAHQLVEEATGSHSRSNIASIRNEVLGENTRRHVQVLLDEAFNRSNVKINAIRDELLGSRTQILAGGLRDDLLGPKTNAAIKAIVDTAAATISIHLRSNVKGVVEDNASFIRKHAEKLLITLAVITAIIIMLVWRNRQKYLKMVTILTSQIHNIPNEKVYDDLTLRIKNVALANNVEKDLNDFLKKNHIAGKEDWEKTQKKKRNI